MAARRRGRLSKIALLVCACVMALISHQHAQTWQSDQALWTAAARLHPTQAVIQWRFGMLAFHAGNREQARQQFRHARAALRDIPRTDPLTGLMWLWTDLVGE